MSARATLRPATWGGYAERVAIVLPGRGYTPDMPLLLWTCRTLNADGWSTQQVWWEDHSAIPEDPREWVQAITASAVEQLAETGAQIVVVGKSLGSLAIRTRRSTESAGSGMSLIAPEFGPDMSAALPKLPPSLLVGGTADSSWDGSVAAASGHSVCELKGADHGLEIPGDPAASIDALKQVVLAVQQYASTG